MRLSRANHLPNASADSRIGVRRLSAGGSSIWWRCTKLEKDLHAKLDQHQQMVQEHARIEEEIQGLQSQIRAAEQQIAIDEQQDAAGAGAGSASDASARDDSPGAHCAKGFAATVPNVDPTDMASCQSLAALQANIQAQLTNWANSHNEHVRNQQAQHQAQQQMQQQNQIAASIQAAQAAAAAQTAPQTAVQEEPAAQSLQPPPPPPPAAPAADGARGPLETAAQMAPQERWASISAAGGTVAGLARTGRIAPAIKDSLKKKAATRTQRASKKGQEEDDLLQTLEAAANVEMPVDLDSEAEPAGAAGAAGAPAGSDGSGL